MKKSIVKFFVSVVVLSVASVLLFSCATDESNQVENEKPSAVWTEVSVPEAGSGGTASGLLMDLKPRETIEKADYIFSGTIVNIKEFEISWIHDVTGETIVSPGNTVMEVKVDKEYKGTNPVEGDTIKIYYALSTSFTMDSASTLKNGAKYLFITGFLDEEFIKDRNENAPDDKHEQEKYADAYIREAVYNVSPIVDDTVFIRTHFFDNMPDVLAKSIDARCAFLSDDLLEYKVYSAFKMEDFEPALAAIIKDPSLAPEGFSLVDKE